MGRWRLGFVEWCETAFGGSLYRAILWLERRIKGPLFGCQMCGQCALRYTGFVCPMQCPKQLRNGPCGGVQNGRCEVYPERPCVWVQIHERARLLHRERELERVLPELDWSLVGTSAWLNHLAGRDASLFHAPAAPVLPLPEPRAKVNEEQLAA